MLWCESFCISTLAYDDRTQTPSYDAVGCAIQQFFIDFRGGKNARAWESNAATLKDTMNCGVSKWIAKG